MSQKPKNPEIFFIINPFYSSFFTFNTPEYVTRNELDRLETIDEEVDKMTSYSLAEELLAPIIGKR